MGSWQRCSLYNALKEKENVPRQGQGREIQVEGMTCVNVGTGRPNSETNRSSVDLTLGLGASWVGFYQEVWIVLTLPPCPSRGDSLRG